MVWVAGGGVLVWAVGVSVGGVLVWAVVVSVDSLWKNLWMGSVGVSCWCGFQVFPDSRVVGVDAGVRW